MSFDRLFVLFLLSYFVTYAQAAVFGTPVVFNSTHKTTTATESRPLTNAERLRSGMTPAFPAPLAGAVPSRIRRQTTRSRVRRDPACASPAPVTFPPHPVQNNPVKPFGNTVVDDAYVTITTSFPMKMFDLSSDTLFLDSNGFVSFQRGADEDYDYQPTGLPTDSTVPPYAVFPYWIDLIARPSYNQFITVQSDATSLSIRWKTGISGISGTIADFWLYYTTQSPGRSFAYYDQMKGADGSSATVGAQGNGAFALYERNTAGTVSDGLQVALDTTCGGSVLFFTAD
ncbi:hypothetical protein IAU60_000424 [Kwoniella sp. DSM 27419]